jgi:hypothetical protein
MGAGGEVPMPRQGGKTEVEIELEVGTSSSEPSDGHGELGNGSRLKEIGEGELGPKAGARSRGRLEEMKMSSSCCE